MNKTIATICLDPGHGPDTVNGSPDGTYREAEFTWDMTQRLAWRLEAEGFSVVVTRHENEKPSLTERANISNENDSDLFLSLHSNATGGDGWSEVSGLLVFTLAPPMEAKRNVAAKALVKSLAENGVEIIDTGIVHNDGFTVLRKTYAPACLIEYGFHTNKVEVELLKSEGYRNTLAVSTVMGVCHYFGVPYSGEEDLPDDWAKSAWEKASEQGIVDGTRPKSFATRQEVVVMLDRLGLLD